MAGSSAGFITGIRPWQNVRFILSRPFTPHSKRAIPGASDFILKSSRSSVNGLDKMKRTFCQASLIFFYQVYFAPFGIY